jgi:L-fuconolactonase
MSEKAADPLAVRHYPIRPEWLDRHREPVLEPDLPIVDAHHHLWDRPEIKYLLPDLVADMATGHNIVATIYLEATAMYRPDGPDHLKPVGETEFARAVAAQSEGGGYGPTRVCAGIVGFADLMLGAAVEEVLHAHITAGRGNFRGVRGQAHWDASGLTIGTRRPIQGMMLDATFRAGFAKLSPLGLSYDAWQFHPQLGELADLARAFPETTIIVNHVGAPLAIGPYADRRQEVFAVWKPALRELSRCPNVVMKLGGLATTMAGFGFDRQAEPPTSVDLARAWLPYIETCIEAFGASRCLFESNFPPDKQSCSYPVLWNAYKRMVAGASADEKAALFAGTAARAYRIEV